MKGLIVVLVGLLFWRGLNFFSEEASFKKKGISKLKLTVVFDNYPHNPRLKTSWGFGCLVEGAEKKILFDTGGDGAVLLHNLRELNIDPKTIDIVVLSHIHGDHVGGLASLLDASCKPVIYLPASFPKSFKDSAASRARKVITVKKPVEVCKHVYTTGEMGLVIKEQGLVIRTCKGLVAINGCSHPGIVKMLKRARDHWKGPIYLSLGGYHLGGSSRAQIEKIVKQFRELGVKRAAPTHCSGDVTRKLFKEAYGEDFIQAGVGKVIEVK